jgi:hypothetical protein
MDVDHLINGKEFCGLPSLFGQKSLEMPLYKGIL